MASVKKKLLFYLLKKKNLVDEKRNADNVIIKASGQFGWVENDFAFVFKEGTFCPDGKFSFECIYSACRFIIILFFLNLFSLC